MADVALVQMPYAAVHHPSIALGLLKSYLTAAAIDADVVYANVLWAEELGLDVYLVLQESFYNDLLGEWTFAATAFPEKGRDAPGYRRLARRTFDGDCARALAAFHPRLDLERLFHLVRDRTGQFVDRLADRILDSGARIVGCSSVFQQHCASLALLRRIREKAPDVVTLLGGANCEGPMGAVTHRSFPWVDFVASGEVDAYFGSFCAELLDTGRSLPQDRWPPGVLGPGYRRHQNGDVPEPALRVPDLDATAVPDYDDYFVSLGRSTIGAHVRPGLLIETSRGCWWGARNPCKFCGLNGSRIAYRSKSSRRVVDELAQLAERHGVNHVSAVDNVLDPRHLKDVIPGLAERGSPYHLFFEVRPNLTRAQIECLGLAGVRWVQAGLESLHDGVLAQVSKGTTTLRNVAFLKWARLAGIRVAWNLLYGAPGEQDVWYAAIAEWIPLIAHLQPPTGMSSIRFDRFSRYHAEPAAHALSLHPHPAYHHVYTLPPADLEDLAYFFEDRSSGTVTDRQSAAGLQRAAAAIRAWRTLFWGQADGCGRPALTMSRRNGMLLLWDNRPVASAAEVALEGLVARVYEECAEPTTAAALAARLRAAAVLSVTAASVAEALEVLQDKKVLLGLGGRFLALAVPEPLRPYADERDAPEGYISMLDVLKTCAPTSLAKRAVRPPWDVPALSFLTQVPSSER